MILNYNCKNIVNEIELKLKKKSILMDNFFLQTKVCWFWIYFKCIIAKKLYSILKGNWRNF